VTIGRDAQCFLLTVSLLIAPFAAAVSGDASGWYLLEPPVEETSDLGKVLEQASLMQWTRIGTYSTEAVCEARRFETIRATVDEIVRLSKTSPRPSRDIFRGANQDRRLAEGSTCVSADDPSLARESAR
jgi:hypothetical protein